MKDVHLRPPGYISPEILKEMERQSRAPQPYEREMGGWRIWAIISAAFVLLTAAVITALA